MQDQIGRIVQEARLRAHLDVATLSRLARVEAGLLDELERGEPRLSTAALCRIAETLELEPGPLLLGREVLRTTVSVFLRHRDHQDFDHQAAIHLERALEAGRLLRWLNDSLHNPPVLRRSKELEVLPTGPKPHDDGYDRARRLRRLLDLPVEPMPDLGALVEERLEVALVVVRLGNARMSAVGLRDRDGAATIVLNADDTHRRDNPQLARVHLAHELCHILFDVSTGGLHLVVDLGDESAPHARRVSRDEQRAKAFAAELLLPLQGLLDVLRTPRSVESESEARGLVTEARARFCTPWEIAVNQLNHQGYIADSARTTLLREGPCGPPPGAIATRLPGLGAPSIAVRDRLRQAHAQGLVTDGQARVALDIAVDEPLPWD